MVTVEIHPLVILVLFAITVVIELALAYLLGCRKKHELGVISLVNVVTNPLANYLLMWVNESWHWGAWETIGFIIFEEIIIIAIEYILLKYALGGEKKKLLTLSIAINAGSLILGYMFLFWANDLLAPLFQ